jgi:glycosyltransferase involved in cell wall biosynthesis
MKSVDVVIPCYNYAKYLRACVDSVLTQPGVETRLLVIDDSSSDETPEIGRELASTSTRIEFIRHERNRGNIATYNEGLLDWACADYTVLLSADDMLTPGSLKRAVTIMEADDSIGLVYGPVIRFTDESRLPKLECPAFSYIRYSGQDWIAKRCRAGHNVITSPEVVVRRSVQHIVGGYRSELPHVADLEMWLRIAAVSNIGFICAVPQAFYRLHSTNMTKSRNTFVDLYQRKAAFDLFWQHHPHILNAERLRTAADRALAREALWRACRAYDHNQPVERRASELTSFAMATYNNVEHLSEWRALHRRQRMGPVICHRTQMFLATALIRRITNWIQTRRWKRRGV